MIFGRGGMGGVVNRVTKEAGFTPLREISLMGGSFGGRRFATDFNHPFSEKAAVRFNLTTLRFPAPADSEPGTRECCDTK
jgi:catecholate siderophore receptor